MLIAFSGLKGAGKDTAAELLVNEYGFTRIAFADAVRQAALTIDPWIPTNQLRFGLLPLSELIADTGWDWAKREIPEVRRLLQVIGTEFGRSIDPDIWVQSLYTRFPDVGKEDTNYVITDCRFENEVSFVHLKGGDVCWIERPELVSDGHASENPAMKDKADYILHNDDSISEFQEDIRFMMFMKGAEPLESRITN